MTLKELNQLAWLENAIQLEKDRLDRLYASAGLRSPGFDTMPHAPGTKDRLGELVPAIVDQEQTICDTIGRYMAAQERLLAYIHDIQSVRLRTIFILRFVERDSWQKIADTLGGDETEYSVKHACYRYLDRDEDQLM